MSRRTPPITPELVLRAYRAGLFPMADRRDSDSLYWLDPEQRGIIPLDRFHVPRRLFRTLRAEPYDVSADRDFGAVVAGCAHPLPGRAETWINPRIEALYGTLHRMGHAHSIECRREGLLVGGLYGVALGGAFFGESMFSLATDASKIALVHLIARLRLGGFRLLDTQFVTDHLGQFGAEEIPRADYRVLLATAVEAPAIWLPDPPPAELAREFRVLAGKEA
jgi:leucyl/phenylalanyl-tRNA--protein transferase